MHAYAAQSHVSSLHVGSHPRLCDALVVLKGLVVVQLPLVPLIVLFPLEHSQQALKEVSSLKSILA